MKAMRSQALRADLTPRSLGNIGFANFIFIPVMSMMAITPVLFMMTDSDDLPVRGPQLLPDSFSVSHFKVSKSNSKLQATWKLDLAFANSSQADDNGYEILFSDIEATIFYEDIEFAVTQWQPFGQGRKEQEKVHLKFVTSGLEGDQPVVDKNVLREIKKEHEMGMIHFSLRINTFATYQKWGLLWRGSKAGFNSYCWDLMVKFSPETGKGRLFGGGQKECRS